MLVDLEVFYLGHLKKSLYNTIQYNFRHAFQIRTKSVELGSMVGIQSAMAENR